MAIAAVPGYLGNDFSKASPGLRFNYYLGIWTTRDDQELALKERSQRRSYEAGQLHEDIRAKGIDEVIKQQVALKKLPGLWEKNERAERKAWRSVLALNPDDKDVMAALVQRQNMLAEPLEAVGQLLRLDAQAVAPFTTGLGSEHPLENGFAFLNPYGLPYLPGSGVKGVLRQAARELASGDWGDTQGWDEAAVTALFGKESGDRDTDHQRGALMFWDVIPQLKDGSLQVEVMTAHQSHYYQKGETPHESGQPNPINFLTVPPGSGFVFHVQCNQSFLTSVAPDSGLDQSWNDMLKSAFEHAFAWLGFGGKTAVGYGAMEKDRDAEEKTRHLAQQKALEEEEKARVEARAREAAVKQAAFDALPESRKLVIELQQEFTKIRKLEHFAREQVIGDLNRAIKAITEQAPGWPEAENREEAAMLLEAIYDETGWYRTGASKKQRTNQEKKKREKIAQIRSKG